MKRVFDFLMSFISIIVFSPIILIISLLIKLTSKGPVFFKQRRIGKNNEEFNILKFRTMRVDTPNVATHLLKDPSVFITPLGKFLRKTSLDELPQLINILKGEMSIVGPRPALYNQYDLIDMRTEVGVHKLVPGLTGWAQVNGRDELEIPIKAKFDGEYVEKMSLLFDTKIFLKTIIKVFKHDGVVEGKVEKEKTEV